MVRIHVGQGLYINDLRQVCLQCAQENLGQGENRSPRFINPQRLFHGVWLPQWLEERPEVSEKAKKLYAYLTYFAGGKGYAWPSFRILAEKLHCCRRHVVRLIQELSAHQLIAVTNVSNPTSGHCANYYRFLWNPWMQNEGDRSFVLAAPESDSVDSEEASPTNCQPDVSPGDLRVTSPLVTSRSPAPSDRHVTPLVTPMSPQENNKKRINYRGKVPATSSGTSPFRAQCTAAPPPRVLSDTTKIILERRVAELRKDIALAVRKGFHERAEQLHTELAQHQAKLGFTPDDPPPKPKAPRDEEFPQPASPTEWPLPEEVSATFNEARRAMGWPVRR